MASAGDLLDRRVARLLGLGTLLTLVLVTGGSLLTVAAGRVPRSDPGPHFDVGRLLPDLVAFRPEGLLWLGLILSLVLPTGRVALALVGFARQGDRRHAVVAAAVLILAANYLLTEALF